MLAGSASPAYRGMPDICQIQKVGSQGKGEEAKHGAGHLTLPQPTAEAEDVQVCRKEDSQEVERICAGQEV